MTILAVAAIVVLGALLLQEKREVRLREDGWNQERTRLLGRILHPEIPQLAELPLLSEEGAVPELPADEYDLVGTVQAGTGPEF